MKPYLNVEWNDTVTKAKGWLVVHNFVKGYAGGGIRMHPSVTRADVERLAECMAYKYKACESEFCGGCKGGIAYDSKAADAKAVLRRYLIAMMPYIKIGVSLGGDFGTSYADILEVFREFGLEMPMTKSMSMNKQILQNAQAYSDMLLGTVDGRKINDIIAGYGVAFCADEAWSCLVGKQTPAKIVIQGMGRLGSACAKKLVQLGHSVIGMADSQQLYYCQAGLDVELLYQLKVKYKKLKPDMLPESYRILPTDSWVSRRCDILIPAALGDAVNGENADLVQARLLVEGANIATSEKADAILKNKGVYLICDFTANLSEAWFYDAVFFGMVKPEVDAVLSHAEQLCRRNAAKQMNCAMVDGIYARESARKLFAPNIQDLPQI